MPAHGRRRPRRRRSPPSPPAGACQEEVGIMDSGRFDRLVRTLGQPRTRRTALRRLTALPFAAARALRAAGPPAAAANVGARRPHHRRKPCAGGTCLVFVSSQTYDGKLGGLRGADAKCQALAAAANLPGAYKAWLADATASPSTRFVKSSGPYQLVDGTTIATDWADLTDGGLQAPIDVTEQQGSPGGSGEVWTNANPDGTKKSQSHCANWTV